MEQVSLWHSIILNRYGADPNGWIAIWFFHLLILCVQNILSMLVLLSILVLGSQLEMV